MKYNLHRAIKNIINMKKTSFNLDSIDSLIEELSDEELAACSGGLIVTNPQNTQTQLNISVTPGGGVDVHVGREEQDGHINLDNGQLILETDASVRARTRGG